MRRRGRICRVWFVGLPVVALVAGCGGPPALPGPQPYPVKGQVTYQGKPAAGFRVSFFPKFEQSGPKFAPSAVTDANGAFELESYQPGDGAPPGDYAVTFIWPQEVSTGDPGDAPQIVDRLHGRLSDPNRSQFRATITAGENVLPPFALK